MQFPKSMGRQRGFLGAILGGISLIGGLKSGRDAKKAGKASAEQERLATKEKVRRLELEERQILGVQQSSAAASGVDVKSKSVLAIQAETIDEMEKEREFTRQAGAFAAESANLRGKAAATQAYTRALTGAGEIAKHFIEN